jgi:hypothetical protein
MGKREQVIRIVAEDDLEEIPDGRSVRVPMMLMDAAYHQPGYRYRVSDDDKLSDARRGALEARDAMIERATKAWRTRRRRDDEEEEVLGAEGQNKTDPNRIGASALDARAATNASYREMCDRISSAWRTPISRDAAQPDAGSRPEELRRYLRGDEPDNDGAFGQGNIARLERKRLSQWQEYRERLASAWRSPIGRTSPNAATSEGSAVERRAAAVEEDRRDFTHEQWRERR